MLHSHLVVAVPLANMSCDVTGPLPGVNAIRSPHDGIVAHIGRRIR